MFGWLVFAALVLLYSYLVAAPPAAMNREGRLAFVLIGAGLLALLFLVLLGAFGAFRG